MNKKAILLLAILLGYAQWGFGQVATEMPPQGPRASALAGTFVAVANDGWAMFHNPAGLANLKSMQAFSSYQVLYINSLTNMMGGFALPSGTLLGSDRFGTVGIYYEYLNTGVDKGQSLTGQSERLATEWALGFSHGMTLLKDVRSSLSFGYNLKMYYLDYGTSAGMSGDGSDGTDLGNIYKLGMDLGVMASLRERVWLGAYLMNFNQPKIGTTGQVRELPQKLSVGASYMPHDGVLTAVGLERSTSKNTRIKGGVEAELADVSNFTVHGRFGIISNPNTYTIGFGAAYHGVHFDYALMIHPILSTTHQFGLMYDFGK